MQSDSSEVEIAMLLNSLLWMMMLFMMSEHLLHLLLGKKHFWKESVISPSTVQSYGALV